MGSSKPLKPWFGAGGDRTLEQQLKGLDLVLENCRNLSVLDVGCAEGLISLELARRGAQVHGVEIRPDFVDQANRWRGDLACQFEVADANRYAPVRKYDIVLMLAVLQKLRDPTTACMTLASAAEDLVVVRLPPKTAPVIIDDRSGRRPHDINKALTACGFKRIAVERGHLDEWMGYYRRVA